VEGPTNDPTIERLRNRQVKNFLALNLLALGTPMVLMGDEMRRTQLGNNNAYCQDSELAWLDWTLLEKHDDIHRFLRQLIHHRSVRRPASRGQSMSLNQLLMNARFQWHGIKRNQPDWGHDSHSLATTARIRRGRVVLHLMVNAYWEALDFEIPEMGQHAGNKWLRWIDTHLDPPDDICQWSEAKEIEGSPYRVQPRSIAVLLMEMDQKRRSRKSQGGPLAFPEHL
jgi:isoamylase